MKELKQIIQDIKNTMYHPQMKSIVYIQARYKNGKSWILRANGESLTVLSTEMQGTTTRYKLAKYVGVKLGIFDADKLSIMSLESLTRDLLDKEKDVDLAIEFSEMVGIDLFEK